MSLTSKLAGGLAPPRFHVAVHVLVRLARSDELCPSAEIASHLQTHSTFLRRVLSPLVQAGIVEAREGRSGGYRLAKAPERIRLSEVYTVVRDASAQGSAESGDVEEASTHGASLDMALSGILGQAEERVLEFLSRFTIADLLRKAGTQQFAPQQ